MLAKFTSKQASDSLVTFVTHKGFPVLFFLPTCCVNSLVRQGSQHSWSLTQFLYGIKNLQSGTKVVDTLVHAFLVSNFIHLLFNSV